MTKRASPKCRGRRPQGILRALCVSPAVLKAGRCSACHCSLADVGQDHCLMIHRDNLFRRCSKLATTCRRRNRALSLSGSVPIGCCVLRCVYHFLSSAPDAKKRKSSSCRTNCKMKVREVFARVSVGYWSTVCVWAVGPSKVGQPMWCIVVEPAVRLGHSAIRVLDGGWRNVK